MTYRIEVNGITHFIVHDRRNTHRLPRILFIPVGDLWYRILAPRLGLESRS